jgi:MFS transporter, YNFM family, putative membrane transport protein
VRREAATERLLRTCQKTTREGEGHTVHGMSSNWLGLSSFGLGAAGMFATVYCTQAILPTLGREFGVGAARTGLTISVVVVAMAAGAWIWGPLSDRIGRKRCLVLSSGLLVAPTVALGLAPSFAVLLVCRLLQGLCMPGLLTVGLNYVQEVFGDWLGGKAMGCYLSSLVAGGLIGRVGVALASEVVGWRLSLAALALLPGVAALLMHYAIPQSASPAKEKQELTAVMRLLGNRALLLATLGGCALFFSFVGVFSFVTYYLEAPPFSLSPALGSLIFLLWSLGAVGPVAGAVADRIGWRATLVGALTGSLLALPLSLVGTLPAVVAALAVLTVAMFSGATAAQIGVATASESDQGSASAIYYSCYYTCGAFAAYLPGVAWQWWGWPGVTGVALGVLAPAAAILLFAGIVREHRPKL